MVWSRRFAQVSSSEEEEEEKGTERETKKYDDETPPKEVKLDDVKPVGEPVKVTGKGKGRRTHYGQFENCGNRYKLEDSVPLYPEDNSLKPYIAISRILPKNKMEA